MEKELIRKLIEKLLITWQGLIGAVVFYTQIPIPAIVPYQIYRIARFAPWVGLLIGMILVLGDTLLGWLGVANFSRAVLLVCLWVLLTGGLHLDGVMDTADGLAVQDPQKRLQVMQDSRTGAFGVLAAVLLIFLKVAALTDLTNLTNLTNLTIAPSNFLPAPLSASLFTFRNFGLLLAPTWGRWGQVLAIALYPYLKPTGKGAFLKQEMQLPQDLCWGLGCLSIITGLQVWGMGHWQSALGIFMGGAIISGLTGYWFDRQLEGHTGDTYGAVVEWTEAIFLSFLVIFIKN
jgi:adenosylcobinamide-GDP ribazoletransferase